MTSTQSEGSVACSLLKEWIMRRNNLVRNAIAAVVSVLVIAGYLTVLISAFSHSTVAGAATLALTVTA
jgi:hypothetical protein